jgi:hypothetical protein
VHGRVRGRDNRDLRNDIRGRDARDRIENRRLDRERDEQELHDLRDHDYYDPYYDQPHRQHSPEGGHILGCVRAYSRDLKRVRWPRNFKISGIEWYDGSSNLAEWLEVYQLTVEATGSDSYVMANYLPVYLSLLARTWLLGPPVRSVRSWNHLRRLFTSNFCATCGWLGVD